MGVRFTGHVLRGARIAPSNSITTGEPNTGVVRFPIAVPDAYTLDAPAFVDPAADQYRAAIIQGPGTTPTEYLVWAENSSQLALLDGDIWWTEDGAGAIPTGTIVVTDDDPPEVEGDVDPPPTYGTDRIIVTDNGGRNVSNIIVIVVARGDVDYDDDGWKDSDEESVLPSSWAGQPRLGSTPYITLEISAAQQVPSAGLVYLTGAQKTELGGGVSLDRGDSIVSVRYTAAPARFWWSRNDRYETRFGWHGKNQRWQPYKGSGAVNVGTLEFGITYKLAPPVRNLPVGAYLPGDSAVPDSYSMLRVGTDAGATGVPVDNVRVKNNAELEDFDFSSEPVLNAVMGQSNGEVKFNPSFVQLHAGKTLWFSYSGFQEDSEGAIGPLRQADLTPPFIAPIPGPTDYPFIRLGSRRPLQPTLVADEAALEAATAPASGSVIVALSTGRLRLSLDDVRKADPDRTDDFDKNYLGENVYYEGVALNAVPQSVRPAVQLLDGDGDPGVANSSVLYVPDGEYLPSEFVADDPWRGLGVSGILDVPDGTGALPVLPGVAASVRAGGDTLSSASTGRVRQVSDGVGDTILFTRKGAIETIIEEATDEDLPSMGFQVASSKAYVAKERGTHGSRVVIGKKDRKRFGSSPIYFLQASLVPAMYTLEAEMFSRNREIFRFEGTETLYFAVDGVSYTWTPATLVAGGLTATFFTAAEVAASLNTDSTPAGTFAREQSGRICLYGTTSVEIGFGTEDEKDLTGSAILGFPPGWRAVADVSNWMPDSGISLGLTRSPVNLDRSQSDPDFKADVRVEDMLLVDSVQESPFVFMNQPPLQDVAGVDDNVFFNITSIVLENLTLRVIQQPLRHYEDIIHRFGQSKFDWIERGVIVSSIDQPTTTLTLGTPNVVLESLMAAPGIGGGLYISDDTGSLEFQDPDTAFVLPQDGIPGSVTLVERYGDRVTYGGMGTCITGGVAFVDLTANFQSELDPVLPGHRLKIASGDNAGSYKVDSVTPTTLGVTPPFLSTTVRPVAWEVFRGYTDAVYDPSLVADISYKSFDHLQEEPFKVRLLHSVGTVGSMIDAEVEGAVASGRIVTLRFGLVAPTSSTVATLEALGTQALGPVANGVLDVPDTASDRFSEQAFSIQVGPSEYSGANVVGVTEFSADPVWIEYLTENGVENDVAVPKGRLKFGSTLISQYGYAPVTYRELFLAPASLTAGQAEFNPVTGALNISSADATTHAGKRLYFVEQLITEGEQDVAINPQLGAFAPNVPIPPGTVAEVEYWTADLEGRRIEGLVTEFLSVFIQREDATREKENIYRFNPDGMTVDERIDPTVWIGAMMQNFGQTDYIVDYPEGATGEGRITFVGKIVAESDPVQVTYAVFEAQGGERTFEASQKPVYRPPFFIKVNQPQFGLRGDREAEFLPGQLIRLGEDCFYIRSLKYYPATDTGGDVTAVRIFPSTVGEVGSRSPGNDVLRLISDQPVTTVVDPDGTTPVATTAPAGFMSTIDCTVFPFEPVSQGQKTVVFKGDLTQFAVPGHILEIAGCPHTIADTKQSEDGSRTLITVTGGFVRGYDVLEEPTIKLSYRPLYPPNTRDFVGCGPMLESENIELVLFGETNSAGVETPGRTLVTGVEYFADPTSGAVNLLSPAQSALGDGQFLSLSFTRVRMEQPYMKNGALIQPSYNADYLYNTLPNTDNGFLKAQVTATYTFHSPDSFYFRAVSLQQFLGEATQEAVAEITSKTPAGGAVRGLPASENWQQGRFGILGERKHLVDKDRAARAFLSFYNDSIVMFEQVKEAISGGIVGDRDGKFRFWVGHDRAYPTPGYEDEITGVLAPRNIWADVFLSHLYKTLHIDADDYVTTPFSASLSNAKITGTIPDTDYLETLLTEQGAMVQNDIDDIAMLRLGKTTFTFTPTPPFFLFKAKGVFASMGSEHRFSRLFPTLSRAFIRLLPGVGAEIDVGDGFDPGVYTAGREIDGKDAKTRWKQIGQLSNPVLGEIDGVKTAALQVRRARGRIWGYFPDGIPAGAFLDGISAAIIEPCVIAFPTLLGEVPINPNTGFPDESKLMSDDGQLGWVPDATAGDPVLAIPGFGEGDQVAWGQPDGTTYKAVTGAPFPMFGTTMLTSAFVNDVQHGCVIRFKDFLGNLVENPDLLMVATETAAGVPAHEFPISRGDTLYAVARTGYRPSSMEDEPELTDTPTFETYSQMASGLDTYRENFDLDVKKDGRVVDKTLWSWNDPNFFGLKELFGQNPPTPMSALEGPVEFVYGLQNPLIIPALEGLYQNDSGDYTLPYLKSGVTEMDRFDQISAGLSEVISSESAGDESVYPDEFLGDDGTVVGSGVSPAALTTAVDVLPGASLGVNDARPFDFLLVQAPAAGQDASFTGEGGLTLGPHGIWSVGAVTAAEGGPSVVEPPRFITHSRAPQAGSTDTGDAIRYTLDNAIVHLYGAAYPPTPQGEDVSGVQVYERAAGVTVLDLTSTPIALNNGETLGTGNLNDIDADGASITIRFIAYPDNLVEFGPAGADPLPSATGGVEALRIRITDGLLELWTYQDDPDGAPSFSGAIGAAVQWGVKEAADPAPGSVLGYRKIIIPLTGFMPWVPDVLPPGWALNKWFLPYEMNVADYEMLYPMEVVIDVDAQDGKLSNRGWVSEDRLTFNEIYDLRYAKERGATHPLTDLSLETQLVVYGTQTGLTAGTEVWSEANKYVNGLSGANPIPFTFVPRDSVVGVWAVRDGDTTERGSLKVMAFEGWGDDPLTAEDVTFSVVPSSDYATDGAAPILLGTGLMGSQFNTSMTAAERESTDNRIKLVGPVVGDVEDVVAGDVAVVTGSSNSDHPGSLHIGTYLVRHGVTANEDPLVGEFRLVSPLSKIDSTSDWCQVSFPEVLSYDSGESKLTISHLAPAGSLASGFAPAGAGTRIYVLVNYPKLASGTELIFRRAVISALYTEIETGPNGEGIFTVSDWKDAKGEAPEVGEDYYTDFEALLEAGQPISGMIYLPVVMGGSNYGLPDNNTVGWDSVVAGKEAVYGWRRLTLNPPLVLRNFAADADKALPLQFNVAGALGDADGGIVKVGAAGNITPVVATPEISNEFYSDPTTPVYHWVTERLDVSQLSDAQWDKLNVPTGSAGAGAGLVNCVLPRSEFRCTSYDDAGTPLLQPGFLAQAGVFLEPSVPRAVADRGQNFVHVVDQDHNNIPDPTALDDWDRVIGAREANDYNPSAAVADPETVSFTIRRIRRFHDVAQVEQNLKPLRFAYEIRRGFITGYVQDNKQTAIVTAQSFTMNWEATKPAGAPKANDAWADGLTYTGTNLGPFDDPDVNIHPGDMFRLLDENGLMVEEARIVTVLGPNQMKLAVPGLALYEAGTVCRFEIWLRQAPVPHEQSNEKLLDLISDSEVTRTDAAWGEASETGGYTLQVTGELTYDDCVNKLYDDQKAPGTDGQTFGALGVRAGDIIVVDPVGVIPQKGGLPLVQEVGVRPLGDEAVPGRTDWDANSVYTAGEPNPLDDNRGFYRVLSIVDTEIPPYLIVDPVTEFTGTAAAPVTFDPTDSTREYAVYPTVNDSSLSEDDTEGQMDLRPTRARNPVTGSFKNYDEGLSNHSVRPFSYRVIRPSALFEDESIDLVLSTRERMQSLIEFILRISRAKGGSYFIFQRDVHIGELGDPTDAELGLGVMSNDFLEMVMGRVEVMPYANNSGCMSVLDRRFWVLDQRLDSLTYDAVTHGMKKSTPGDPTYTAYTDDTGGLVRPVLPDLIDGVLDHDERFRAVRYVWLSYRVHTVLGTLAAIQRFDDELPARLAEREQLLLQLKSTEDV